MVKLPAGFRYSTVRCQLFSLARTTSGRVCAWGYNPEGQLGDGATTDRLTPARVELPSGVKVTAVRAGDLFAPALTSTGKVFALIAPDRD